MTIRESGEELILARNKDEALKLCEAGKVDFDLDRDGPEFQIRKIEHKYQLYRSEQKACPFVDINDSGNDRFWDMNCTEILEEINKELNDILVYNEQDSDSYVYLYKREDETKASRLFPKFEEACDDMNRFAKTGTWIIGLAKVKQKSFNPDMLPI